MSNLEAPESFGFNLFRIGDEFAYRVEGGWVMLGTYELESAKEKMSRLYRITVLNSIRKCSIGKHYLN